MNASKLRSKRVLLPAIATVAVLGAGVGVWTATADDSVGGDERDRVAAAAVAAVGGGTAVEVEASDDPGETYEVEVRTEDGSEVDVTLDADLAVIGQESDDREDDGGSDRPDADDRALTDEERTAVEKAALASVGGGTVLDAEASDDGVEAYEVEVRAEDGTEWDVSLDADLEVLSMDVDD